VDYNFEAKLLTEELQRSPEEIPDCGRSIWNNVQLPVTKRPNPELSLGCHISLESWTALYRLSQPLLALH